MYAPILARWKMRVSASRMFATPLVRSCRSPRESLNARYTPELNMQNEKGEAVDLYIPRKW
jgi:hypothetical protein